MEQRQSEHTDTVVGEQIKLGFHGVEKAARDARLPQIYEGTNQINRFEIMEGILEERGA